ncbi:MAG: hypothetical protein ACI8ZB_001133 [Desulforhopalus sp.]|jgi:hypothetical protein
MELNRNVFILLFLLVLPGLNSGAYANTIPTEMQKLGEGQAYYLKFIKVYDATLYWLEQVEGKNILSSDVSKCLSLEYVVDIGKKDFIKAANSVLKRQFSREQLAPVSSEIETFHQSYQDVRDGDSYTLCYNSMEKVTSLSYNRSNISTIHSPAFAEIYFSIWLGNSNPLDENLRDDLLAGLQNN